ncbi:transcriptional regulatory protein moc3 [Podospora conica]|nr:transcriptional regulatory protein moc3 [Schizothecium conicum]
MDRPIPIVRHDEDLSWSDRDSMDSDEYDGLPGPPWLASLSAPSTSLSTSSVLSFAHTGQLSPISNGVAPPSGSTDSSAGTSSSSSSPSDETMVGLPAPAVPIDAWDMGYPNASYLNDVASRNHSHDAISWEHGPDGILIAAKSEPLDDDDFCMDDVKEAPMTPIASSHLSAADQQRIKRPRGRPRKHPLTPNVAANKVTKGRSKTGCLTCRKRKKKCDEAKPRCMNCEKNAVVCEGYPEKQIWKSGKERAEEERIRSHSLPLTAVQPIFSGLETIEDRIFFKHYHEQLSTVLTVEGEHKNAFKDMMILIAVKHQGLMHSILSLSSKHLDLDTPYGLNLLKNHPSTSAAALLERSLYHHDQARLKFYDDVQFSHAQPPSPDYGMLVSARYGQMLCFLLEALAEGNPRGEHRVHLSGYKTLISSSPPDDGPFLSFIAEFFQYHIFADELIHSAGRADGPEFQKASPGAEIQTPRLLGVADGLLGYLSQITAIRNSIRSNMARQVDPVVNYQSLYLAAEIDAAIRDWAPDWPAGDSRERVGLLYKQMVWVYLVRTIYPPSSSPPSSMSSSLASIPRMRSSPVAGRSSSSAVNTPPHSASTSCTSSPTLSGSVSSLGDHASNGMRQLPRPDLPSRKSSASSATFSDGSRAESPPPIRRPPELHDPRITLAVDESLDILDTFKPSDPSQTLLLLPCFVIGTACFTPGQQDRVRAAVKTAKGYTGMRNADLVMQVLEEVWQLMAAGRWAEVWDWPGVARRLGLDFIPA